MGTSQSTDLPKPPTKKEFVIDNSFRKRDDNFFGTTGPNMSKALTFDERKLLSRKPNTIEGPNLKRALTFVSRTKVDRRNSFSLEDVMFRRHFGEVDASALAIPPQSELKFEEPTVTKSVEKCVVIVDTFSTGSYLAYLSYMKGYKVICVLSADLEGLLDMVPEGLNFTFAKVLSFSSTMEDSKAAFKILVDELKELEWPIAAIMAGAETGVELADQLSSEFGLRTNGTDLSVARRNKFVMGEAVRSAGVRAVKQLQATNWGQIQTFLDEWKPDPFKVIVKPMDSAGSDDVTLCFNITEAQNAFGKILGKVNGLGLVNRSVLVQEYLEGTEYVIDMVSKDGEHKVVAIWEYERRPANGAPFVCHGQQMLIVPDNPDRCEQLINYQKQVCTALGILNGPSHGEVKWFKGEPVLVEVGSRCHGGDGLWVDIATESVGFNQAQATVDLFLENSFDSLPSEPRKRKAFCSLKFLVSYEEGVLEAFDPKAVEEISNMPSYRGHQFFIKQGGRIRKTENCFSWAGCVKLVNSDKSILEKDYARIEELQKHGLYKVKKTGKVEVPCVAVVDPFSTGACLAAELCKKGYNVVAVYSAELEKLSAVQSLVPEGLVLDFIDVIGFEVDLKAMVDKIKRNLTGPLLAMLPGAETGVELADQLSSLIGLRSNGTELSVARRNKFVMGETIRKAGVRAVKQLLATTLGQVETFLTEWQPNPFKVIVKPMDSAGSEDVTLCCSMEEVKTAFGSIFGKINGLGLRNTSVLIQEYLEGVEYVVDMVSRDGVHKVVALWEYDRKPVNGASFVCFGQELKIVDESAEKYQQIVDYQKQVCTALGIRNGPSHGEVKWCNGEPVLVEVGSRCHGAEGCWVPVADAVMQYNQVSATLDAYFSQEAFDALPSQPMKRYGHGRVLFLISKKKGILSKIDAELVEEIRQMKSFLKMEVFLKPGQKIEPTTNCFTFGGMVQLANTDYEILDRDYNRIREMEDSDLFVCE